MSYDEAREATVTRAEALAEVKRHGCSVEEFLSEMGDRDEYSGSDVLDWLGY